MENFVLACFSIFVALSGELAFAKAGQDSYYLVAVNSTKSVDTASCPYGSADCNSEQSDVEPTQPRFTGVSTTSCVQEMRKLLDTCRNENTSATNSCDEKQDKGVMGTLRQATSILGTATAASVQAACSKMAEISQAANAAMAAYQANCASDVSSCQSSCSRAVNYWNSHNKCVEDGSMGPPMPPPSAEAYEEARDLLKTCQDMNKKADDAGKALQNYALTAANAQHCADESSGTSTAAMDICKANPQIEGCTDKGPVDCTKPEMSSNKVCICSKNPNDPSCIGVKSAGANNTFGTTEFASRVGTSGAGINGEDNYGVPGIEQGKANGSFGDPSIEGKQGAGANLSANSINGSAGGSGKNSGEGKGDKAPQEVTSGFYGGGGGSGGGYTGDSSGESRGGLGGMMGRVGAALKKGSADLRQFLPGGNMDPNARGLAGASGPDGITGPHTNIWQKVQNRYQVVRPSLLP